MSVTETLFDFWLYINELEGKSEDLGLAELEFLYNSSPETRVKHFNELSEQTQFILELATPIFEVLAHKIRELRENDYERGKLEGRITFEVLTIVWPCSKPAEVAKTVQMARALDLTTKSSEELISAIVSSIESDPEAQARLATELRDVLDLVNQERELCQYGCCFQGDTLVHTSKGYKPIKSVMPGDLVLSQDPISKVRGFEDVQDKFVTHPSILLNLTFSPSSPSTGKPETISCTGVHPFYVVENQRFVPAEQITLGEHVLLENRGTYHLSGVTKNRSLSGFTTYNLKIADKHTYFVGNPGIWVHNASSQDCAAVALIFAKNLKKARIAKGAELDKDEIVELLEQAKDKLEVNGVLERNDEIQIVAAITKLTQVRTLKTVTYNRTLGIAISVKRNSYLSYRNLLIFFARLKQVGTEEERAQELVKLGLENHHGLPRYISQLLGIPPEKWDDAPAILLKIADHKEIHRIIASIKRSTEEGLTSYIKPM